MHNNYYFLRHLSKSLHNCLEGSTLVECFSQNKNELIIGFDSNGSDFFIKAHLKPSFCCLYFPDDFSRANKNSVNLFTSLKNQKVVRIYQFLNERCFSIDFESGQKLLFKMHGNRSNVISFNVNNEVIEVFNSKLKNDFRLSLIDLDRPINQSKEAFFNENGDLGKLFPTFGKVLKMHLKAIGYSQKSIEEKWNIIQNILSQIEKPPFFIIDRENTLYLSLLPENGEPFSDAIEAINTFFLLYVKTASIRLLKKEVLSQVDRIIKQSKNYIAKNEKRLENVKNNANYSQLADIIMANLHQIDTGTKEVTLSNFYQNNEPVKIKLKENLSPQKNAENYYRKSKNQVKEIENLKESIERKVDLALAYEIHRSEIEDFEDYKSLKKYVDLHDLGKDQVQKESNYLPFNEHNYQGFKIYVGNNAKNNDKMLREYTSKDDLWLHAKDVSGSHVIIKQQPGKNFPKPVIEKAAQLAALNSKRKTDSLCPVIVTPRKYVRKRKGDPAGAVVVEKEEVIMVKPLKKK